MIRVRVYRNLNKGGLSIKTKIEGKWRVTDYAPQAILKNCTFRTSDKERERIANGGNKSVHAWIEGDLISTDSTDYAYCFAPIPYYNPHKTVGFEIEGAIVKSADICKVYSPPKKRA